MLTNRVFRKSKSVMWLFVIFIAIIGLTSGCLAQGLQNNNIPSQMSPRASSVISLNTSTVTKLFDLANKTRKDVISDFQANNKNYNDFKKPRPDTTSTADFTDRDYLLENLSAAMGSSSDWLRETEKSSDANYDIDAKYAILDYFYSKHLYDLVESGKMTVSEAKAEYDNINALASENSLDYITNISSQIDSGMTFAQIRGQHSGWFKDNNAAPSTKGPRE